MQNRQTAKRQDLEITRYALAIDLGSGGLKAAIVADSGEVVASAQEKITTYLLPRGGAEQDPADW